MDLSFLYDEDTNGCWIWNGVIRKKSGYGSWGGGNAHRIVFEVTHGRRLSSDEHLDHLCRVRACVNPLHLEVVTLVENVLRGESPTAVNARKTKCSKGHPLDRLYGGKRQCSRCHRDRSARWRAKQRITD